MDAHIIIGANYGDEGKGTVTARIAKQYLGNTLNVMTNGGSQRGHSILTKDGSITYQHFGSGTYYGADTFYTEFFILNPAQFVREWNTLIEKPNVFRDPNCRWTTIWDMMANQISEALQGRHASCGMGIWNTIRRHNAGICMRFDDFMRLDIVEKVKFIKRVKEFYEKEMNIDGDWEKLWNDHTIMNHFIIDCEFMKEHTVSGTIRELLALKSLCTNTYDNLVFENGQGLLLKDTGKDTFDTTPSDTGSTYALQILDALTCCGMNIDTTLHYVTRPYLTRHGDGHLEDQQSRLFISGFIGEDRTNHTNQFQGEFRYGLLDISNLKKRVEEDARGNNYVLDITHSDEMDREFEFNRVFDPGKLRFIDTPMV